MSGNHQTSNPTTLRTTVTLGILVLLFGMGVYFVASFVRSDHKPVSAGKDFLFEIRHIKLNSDQSIQLQVLEDRIEVTDPSEWKNAKRIYVSIIEQQGHAVISTISMYDPENADFIEASVKNIPELAPYTLKISYPFEQILPDKLPSGKFKKEYWKLIDRPDQQLSALINVRQGKATVMDILIGNKSIHEVAKENN
jgi:hypothetical protein